MKRRKDLPTAVMAAVESAPSVMAAARALNVDPSTIHRWIKAGLVPRPGRRRQRAGVAGLAGPRQSPSAWARWVRRAYVLSGSEQQLVTLAEDTLTIARDPASPAAIRLAAAGRYQRLLEQLDLPEDAIDGEAETTIEATAANVWRFPRRVS